MINHYKQPCSGVDDNFNHKSYSGMWIHQIKLDFTFWLRKGFSCPIMSSFFLLMTGQSWHIKGTQHSPSAPLPLHKQMCQEDFMRSWYELSINPKQSSVEYVILPPILPSSVRSKMKRSQHCIAPLALCKYYMLSLDMLVSITSTLWLHYFWNAQLCRWLQGMT